MRGGGAGYPHVRISCHPMASGVPRMAQTAECGGILMGEMAKQRTTTIHGFWLLCLASCLGGCSAQSITQGGFNSPAPAARTFAVEQTVNQARASGAVERSDLKSMVELLLADDSMVRFVAIAGLVELTGESRGYRFFDPPAVRYQAILRWRDFVRKAPKTIPVKTASGSEGSGSMARTRLEQDG